MQIITGFHAIEEKIKSLDNEKRSRALLMYEKAGPRIKKIIEEAKKSKIECRQVATEVLEKTVSSLNELARDHRGIVLEINGEEQSEGNIVQAEKIALFLKDAHAQKKVQEKNGRSIVVALDSITDPHNVGAIIRSCDQFGADLVILPTHHGATESEIIARSSAGAASWVPISFVPNLARTLENLKKEGYWVYGADAKGETLETFRSSEKIVIVMGSEGSGMSRLVREKCDGILSIPTCGKLDSLNVSVAAGILLYELSR